MSSSNQWWTVAAVWALAAVAIMLTGCDPEVSSTNDSYVDVEKDVNCRHFSYCYTCMIGFGSKQTCGFKASSFCPGQQLALIRITDVRSMLKSGRIRNWQKQEVIRTLGGCR